MSTSKTSAPETSTAESSTSETPVSGAEPTPAPPDSAGSFDRNGEPPFRSGSRSRWLRKAAFVSVTLLGVLVVLGFGVFFAASSSSFEELVRRRLVRTIETSVGGRVEISAFHWDLLHLRMEVDGLTIHGLEAAGEAPYAHLERLRLQVAILGLFTVASPNRVILREAQIQQPSFHLIVYPNGSTNQPHPQHPYKSSKPAIDSLFDAQIGQLAVEQGSVHIKDEASIRQREQVIPFELRGRDANLHLSWVAGPGSGADAGSYHIDAGIGDVNFAEGKVRSIPSRIDASLQLFHDGLRVDSLRIAALGRQLTLRGSLKSFSDPVWQAEASGQVDLRVLAPYAEFPFSKAGVATLGSSVVGHGKEFMAKGSLSATGVHFQDPVVDIYTNDVSAQFRADPKHLVVSGIHTRLLQGGELTGDLLAENWLDFTPSPATQAALRRAKKTWPVPSGVVHATISGVSLDTVLVILAGPAYRHLGLDTVFTGPATASWTGLGTDLAVAGQLDFVPLGVPVPGEAPVHGRLDATYREDAGVVDVRSMDVRLPHSSIEGAGSLGVFPVDRASAMDLDFQSSDLSEFDAVLRTLQLKQGNRVGTAALPAILKGQAKFHGQLSSSWLTPRVDGHLTASNIAIQFPTNATESDAGLDAEPVFVHWDSVDANASYSPASIVVRKSLLRRGGASLSLAGRIDSPNPKFQLDGSSEQEFPPSSTVNVTANAQQFPLEDLLPIAGIHAPVTGNLTSQLNLQGQLKAITGSGTFDLAKLTVYGESIEHLHVAAAVAGKQIQVTSFSALQSAGNGSGQMSGSGSYDMDRRSFQVSARGTGINLASFNALKNLGTAVSGKLGFTLSGDGTVDDPHVQAHADLSEMRIASEPVADVVMSATSSEKAVHYEVSSHQPAGDFTAQGATSLNADYTTQANLKFSKFDIGALLKLLKVKGITGQSDLEGTATISGPLIHPERLGGEATLRELAVIVQGVHLASKGSVHAKLANGIARLDPVEITGEDTDLKLRGTLAVTGKKQLDVVADGSVNLRLAESLDPDLIASGVTTFQMEAHGGIADPILQGRVEFQNASLGLQDFPSGLSQIKGTLEFVQNRLEVRSLTAMSGGGQLSVSGYLGFQRGLYADLTATGKSIRVRYPQGVSSLADATLRLQGPQNNLMLNGNVQVTRFAINSDLDMAAFAAQGNAVQGIVSPDAPSNHVRLDVHLTSAPQLNFQNAYAKLAGDVDLHLRGTIASPSLLGRISITEGSTSIGGTKYELQRGDIYFNNPVRIQPNIDVDATARVEDYDITLGLHGTSDKLNITYRSEPPLSEADVIGLLALGRTQEEQTASTQQQQQGGDNPTTDALLGGALNATVSNRVQQIFGSGAVKIDPNYIGTIGNTTTRITVVEQVGKNLIFTFASNVNSTTEQLIQAEYAINRHVSLLVTQDESGVFSVVVKARRRFK